MKPFSKEIGTKQLAYMFEVTSKTIAEWSKPARGEQSAGWLFPAKLKYGKFDVKLAHNLYIKHQILPRYEKKQDGESLQEAKRRKEIAQANLHELKESSLRGDLVEKDQAIKWLVALISEAKTAFVALPRRLAPVLYGMADIRQIENELRSEIMKILEKLSRSSAQRNGKKAVEIAQPEGKKQLQ